MSCDNISFDNRETCVNLTPSSCVPYTGYVSPNFTETFPCRPNVNDILKSIQILLDGIKTSLGDNKTLDKGCLTYVPATVTQVQLNQIFTDQICTIKSQITGLGGSIDPTLINLTVNLLCLLDPACEPETTYTLLEVINKLITAYCSLLARVTNIETILNI